MSSLSPNLQTALDAFRERVLNDKVTTLSHLLSRLEKQASEEASAANRSDTETQTAVLRTLAVTYLQGDLPLGLDISRARDLLEVDNRRVLAEHFCLDGVLNGDVNVEEIQLSFTSVQNELASLREKSHRNDLEGHWPAALPSELQNLMTHVRGILRPGLPYYNYDGFEPDFFVPRFERRVFSPRENDELALAWPGWDVVAAVRLAQGDPAATLALFCKGDHEASSTWAWRYGICDDYLSSELFDDFPSFLDWVATIGGTTEEDIASRAIAVDWGLPHSVRGPWDAVSVDALLRSGAVEQRIDPGLVRSDDRSDYRLGSSTSYERYRKASGN